MSNLAIRAERLSKQYRIGGRRASYRTLRETIVDAVKAPGRRARQLLRGQAYGAAGLEEVIWALKEVSFEVQHGEVIGIIGRNGAGKSTLLKVLSRITDPTEGEVRIRGRVGSLLEVGTGFHPELTGRENIYLNGAILGMTRKEIDHKFEEIVDFAGVEKFIDTPVKHYSSGMGLRLGFAVAAHLEPEILVVDEVLAVGDMEFQKKCLGKMGAVAESGRTVLFVSHNMAAIQNLCGRAYLLDHGQLIATGDVGQVVGQYTQSVEHTLGDQLADRVDRQGDGRLRFTSYRLFSGGQPVNALVVCGSPVTLALEYSAASPLQNVHVSVSVKNALDEPVAYLSNDMVAAKFATIPARGVFYCHFERFPFLAGIYTLNIFATISGVLADWVKSAAQYQVIEGDYYGTGKLPPGGYSILVDHTWEVRDA